MKLLKSIISFLRTTLAFRHCWRPASFVAELLCWSSQYNWKIRVVNSFLRYCLIFKFPLLSRWQLTYYSTSFRPCQALFQSFWSFLEELPINFRISPIGLYDLYNFQAARCLLTAYLSYHIKNGLSSTFFRFFKLFFERCRRSRDSLYRIPQM